MPALTTRLIVLGALVLAFLAFSFAVAAGLLASLDGQVLRAMSAAWDPPLHPLFQAIAELGGIELTSVLMLLLVIFMLRGRYNADAWVVIAFVAAEIFETLYKANLVHPGPPRGASHADGPSVTEFLVGPVLGNSYPSGHVVRAVVVYGLLAFVARRLSPSRLVRVAAVPVALLVMLVVAFDRLYLDVHWESDVIGGLLLGAIALLAGTVWLDRPRTTDN